MERTKLRELRKAFKSYDVNKDGSLSFEEVKLAIENTGVSISKQEIRDIFRECDLDGDKSISWQEFKAYSGY